MDVLSSFSIVVSLSWFSYYVFVNLIHGHLDSTGLAFGIKMALYFLAAYGVALVHYNYYGEWAYCLMRSIAIAGLLNSIIVSIFFIFPNIQEIYAGYIVLSETQSAWLITGHRFMDFGMGGGASASAVFAIFIPVALSLYMQSNKKGYLFLIPFYLFAIALTGRSGLIIAVFLLIFSLMYSASDGGGKGNRVGGYVFLFLLLGFVSFLAVSGIDKGEGDSFIEWVSEPFVDGVMESKSVQSITGRMYFLPDSEMQILIGDGNFGRTMHLPYIPSDVGWVRLIHAGGFVGVALIILFFLGSIFFSLGVPKPVKLFLYGVWATIFIMMFKELHWLPRGGGGMLMLAVAMSCVYLKENSREGRVALK